MRIVSVNRPGFASFLRRGIVCKLLPKRVPYLAAAAFIGLIAAEAKGGGSQPPAQIDFCKAILARQTVTLSGTVLVDSFDSMDPSHSNHGQYDPATREDGADIASIADSVSVITGMGNARVYGQLVTSPGGTVSINGNVSVGSVQWVNGGNSGIQPGWSVTSQQASIPNATVPNLYFSNLQKKSGKVNGTNYSYVVTSGNYQVSSSFSPSGNICINGDVALYLKSGLQLSGQNFIYIAPGAHLTVYLGGSSSIAGGGTINGTGLATNCAFIATSGCSMLQLSGGSDFVGTIYAPSSTVKLSGGGTGDVNFAGAVVGNTVTLTGSYQFHYDESLCGGCSAPSIIVPPLDQTVCSGGTAVFTVGATGKDLSYQWYKGSTLLAGQTGTTLTIGPVSVNDQGTYEVVVSAPCGNSTRKSADLAVGSSLSIAPLPNMLRAVGASATFTAAVTGSGPMTYVWQKDGHTLEGQTLASLSLTNLSIDDSGVYTVTVIGQCNTVSASGTLVVDSCFPSVDVALVIDRSGSMNGQPYLDAKAACTNFFKNLHLTNDADQAALVSYNSSASLNQKLTNSLPALENAVKNLPSSGGYTSISLGLQTAQDELASARHNPDALPVIVLLSDGNPTSSDTPSNAIYTASLAKAAGTRIFTVGFGNVTASTLTSIASSPDDFYYGKTSSQLSSLFDAISTIICRPPTNIVVTGLSNQTVCAGSPVQFGVMASGCDSFTYQWYKNGQILPGKSLNTLSIGSASTNDAGVYSVAVMSSCQTVTNSAVLTVNQPALVFVPPVDTTVCYGGSTNLSVVADGTGLIYQWYQGANLLANETNASLSLSGLTSSGAYSVVVQGLCGNIVSNRAVVTVAAAPYLDCAQNKTAELGSSWDFDVPTSRYPVLVVSTTTNMVGHCGNSFDATRTWAAIDACGNSAQCSQTVTIVDTTAPLVNCGNTNKTVELGAAWTFDPPTATDLSSNVTITILNTVTNSVGHCGNTFAATRTWAAIDACGNSAQCSQTVTIVDTTAPLVNCGNTNKTVELGAAWTFDPPTATDLSSNVTITILNTVTNSVGHCGNTFAATRTWAAIDACGNSAQCSQTVTIVDTTAPLVNCGNTNKTVELGAAWTFDPPTATDLSSNVTITILSTITNSVGYCGNTFAATRTWAAIDACGNSAQCSQTVTVRDMNPIVVTIPPADETNCMSSAVNFSIVATGTDLSYAWYFGGAVVGTGPSLVVSGITETNRGIYSVVVTDKCGDSVTNSAFLELRAPTTASFIAKTVKNLGDTVTFQTTAGGAGPFTFVWKKDGQVIPSATTPSLTISNLTYNDAGTYTVEVTGSCNTAVRSATLAINHPPTVNIFTPTNGTVFVAPASFVLGANAQDNDGIVTNVEFYLAGTNHFADSTTPAPAVATVTNLGPGTFAFTATAVDNLGARGTSAPVSITVIRNPPLTIVSAIHLNLQTGLFEETVRVTNPTPDSFDAIRVYIAGLTNGTTVHNASGETNGIPYVESHNAIPAGGHADFVIEYYIPSRIIPAPTLYAELVPPPQGGGVAASGDQQHIDRGLLLKDGTFLVEFMTISNRLYSIQYSSDLITWKQAGPLVTGNGTRIQWIDNGEPKTDIPPSGSPQRFYRVILLP